ncbi:hypothetical protein KFL_000540110 [Klebsormidium nitens]|uniref:Uncharacterized protein n=1 Tax=Klebsormidium nitens TaxID=105231 RepID=A0A0U9HI71_KLENI|nr:hypothetical protein KFL_000540110 [Klebsormidium nitens]|eukprot:GAQ80434.1 hypothetical protein KFL_000540110 [Klebsormidium nitens]
MGMLEGLYHREYVEGADDDYQTSTLTSPDCNLNRFGQASDDGGDAFALGGTSSSVDNRRLHKLDSVRTKAFLTSSPVACLQMNRPKQLRRNRGGTERGAWQRKKPGARFTRKWLQHGREERNRGAGRLNGAPLI